MEILKTRVITAAFCPTMGNVGRNLAIQRLTSLKRGRGSKGEESREKEEKERKGRRRKRKESEKKKNEREGERMEKSDYFLLFSIISENGKTR